MDLARDLDAETVTDSDARLAIRRYWSSFEPVGPEDEAFAERLVYGVVKSLAAIDQALADASHHWRVARMGKVDRNLLRVAAYEMVFCSDIPRAVSINEAIEIAKRYNSSEAAAFINGILDQLTVQENAKPEPPEQPDR